MGPLRITPESGKSKIRQQKVKQSLRSVEDACHANLAPLDLISAPPDFGLKTVDIRLSALRDFRLSAVALEIPDGSPGGSP